jgi:hypothetical protein
VIGASSGRAIKWPNVKGKLITKPMMTYAVISFLPVMAASLSFYTNDKLTLPP